MVQAMHSHQVKLSARNVSDNYTRSSDNITRAAHDNARA